MRTLNVGVIGGGFVAKAHSAAYATMPMFYWPAPARFVRKAIADRDEELAREAAARYGYEWSTGDWRRIVEDPAIDVLDIATSDGSAGEIVFAAARAGKHIVAEALPAVRGDEAGRLLAAVDDAGVAHMMTFSLRRLPAMVAARRLMEEGVLGELLAVHASYTGDGFAAPEGVSAGAEREADGPEASPTNLDTNVLDVVRHLAGEIEAVQVTTGGAGSPTTVVLLRFAGGGLGALETVPVAYGRRGGFGLAVRGSKGGILFDYSRAGELQLVLAGEEGRDGARSTLQVGEGHPYVEGLWPVPALGAGYGEIKIVECYELAKAIVEGSVPSPSFWDGYRVARVFDALAESRRTGRWAEVGGD